MNLVAEFLVVVLVYTLVLSYFMKRVGGKELYALEKEIKKQLDLVKSGKKEAMDKLNQLNSRRMQLTMRGQLYLFPFIIAFFYFVKRRYADISVSLFGLKLGWFGLFIVLSMVFGAIAEQISRRLLNYE